MLPLPANRLVSLRTDEGIGLLKRTRRIMILNKTFYSFIQITIIFQSDKKNELFFGNLTFLKVSSVT